MTLDEAWAECIKAIETSPRTRLGQWDIRLEGPVRTAYPFWTATAGNLRDATDFVTNAGAAETPQAALAALTKRLLA